MVPFSYLTIQAPVQGIYKEKGSKFLAFASPVGSEEEVKNNLKALKKEYFDARHHGYAYVLGPGKEKYRAFDDGEPNHSTGDPILGQIRSKNLTNVLVVVVRYFGGVKLGVGGLIAAYKTAAEEALNKAAIIELEVTSELELLFEYEATSDVMRAIKEFDAVIIKQDFIDGCRMVLSVKLRHRVGFVDKISLLKAVGVKVAFAEL
ncbi:MAG: YigZ family protein [Bacteroidota bacterium]